ncbi:hypothetical protein Tco_1456416 [Tanacetum coccineum]
MADIPKSFPLVHKDHLLDLFNQEVGEDVARVREYRVVAYGLKIAMRMREEYIGELKALGGCEGAVETVRFMGGVLRRLTWRGISCDTVQSSSLFLADDYNFERSERFPKEAFGFTVVPTLVLCSFTRSVSDFLAGMVETIMRATSSMRSCGGVPAKTIVLVI